MELMLKDDRWCFACGTKNPHGLMLDDIHLEGLECVCTFTPQQWHQGWTEILHGGITSTLLDEIMTHLIYRLGWDAVTAEMTVRYKKAIPIGEPVQVRSRLTRMRGKFAETEGTLLLSDGDIGATATAKFFVTRRERDTAQSPVLTFAARHAVICDLFGTLVPVFPIDVYHENLAAVAEVLGMDCEPFSTAFAEGRVDRFTGKIPSIRENFRQIARQADLPVTDGQVERAAQVRLQLTRKMLMSPFPDALALLSRLRDAGRSIALLSDCSPDVPELWSETPLAEFFSDPILSCVEGVKKPEPRAYQLTCERAGIDPYETIFVGDGGSNELAGARDVGICPVLIDRGETDAFRIDASQECDTIVTDLTQVLPLIGLEAVSE